MSFSLICLPVINWLLKIMFYLRQHFKHPVEGAFCFCRCFFADSNFVLHILKCPQDLLKCYFLHAVSCVGPSFPPVSFCQQASFSSPFSIFCVFAVSSQPQTRTAAANNPQNQELLIIICTLIKTYIQLKEMKFYKEQ